MRRGRRRTRASPATPPSRARSLPPREQYEECALPLRGRFVDALGAVATRGYEAERRARLVPAPVSERGPEACALKRVGRRDRDAVEVAREEVRGVFRDSGRALERDDAEAPRAAELFEREP